MTRHQRRLLTTTLAFALACGGGGTSPGTDAGLSTDSGILADGGSDAGMSDDGGPDAGSSDAGVDGGGCLLDCDDGDPCTADSVVSGSADTCDLVCDHRDISGDADDPDDAFEDSNCDGVDGTLASLVFVATDGTDGDLCGTTSEPCQTLGRALSIAAASGLDVAVSQGTYAETITLPDGVSIHGGYDRASDWSRSVDHSVIVGGALLVDAGSANARLETLVAVDITTPTTVEHLTIRTPNASDSQTASVLGARLVNAGALALRHVVVLAGAGSVGDDGANGAMGRPGITGSVPLRPTALGVAVAGGAGGPAQVCEGTDVRPGTGGQGGSGGADPQAGCLRGHVAPSGGQVGSIACGTTGAVGQNGDCWPLTDINSRDGGAAGVCDFEATGGSAVPAQTYAGGVVATTGAIGEVLPRPNVVPPFTPAGEIRWVGGHGRGGSGGGGGGAGDQGDVCASPGRSGSGGGGGGGGSGGCGGRPGQVGGAGGASIGILAIASEGVTFEDVAIASGPGGAGGAGGDGGLGGMGGPGVGSGGTGVDVEYCTTYIPPRPGGMGAAGSPGAQGGAGAGGQGGASVGLLLCRSSYVGTPEVRAGLGGEGGIAGDGLDGIAGNHGLSRAIYEGCVLNGWEFNSPADGLSGWRQGNNTTVSRSGDALRIDVSGGDPWVYSPAALGVDTRVYKRIRFRMATDGTGGTLLQVFFRRAGEGYAESRSGVATLVAGTEPNEYVLDFSANAEWTGLIEEVRFDITDGASGFAIVDYFAFDA
ncbi:MAG: hypothetical protein R3B99_14830 [Polyangiales bacterium]